MDTSQYKHRLLDYLNYKNVPKKGGFFQCPNTAHSDSSPSAKLYNNESGQHLHCMSVCNQTYDIFDVAGFFIGSDDFKEQLAEVQKTLGVYSADDRTTPEQSKAAEYKENKQGQPVSIPISKLNEVYNDERILQYAVKSEYGDTITGKYICYDKSGKNVDAVEYRFEHDTGAKTVFLIWYNGRTIKWTNPPRLIFGLNEIVEGKPFLIVEGPKTREIASQHLPDFNVLTWNGGANNVDKVDWCSIIPDDAEVYLWADDDQPGMQAMMKIEEVLK